MKVFVIIKAVGEDYHGTYLSIVEVWDNKEKALKRIKELEEECIEDSDCNLFNTDFYIERFNVKK